MRVTDLSPSRVQQLAPLLPYVAVLGGLYWLHSAWVAVLLYHLGMVAMLSGEKQWSHGRALFAGYAHWHVPVTAVGGIGAGALLFLLWPLMGMSATFGGQLARFGLTTTLLAVLFRLFHPRQPVAGRVVLARISGLLLRDAPPGTTCFSPGIICWCWRFSCAGPGYCSPCAPSSRSHGSGGNSPGSNTGCARPCSPTPLPMPAPWRSSIFSRWCGCISTSFGD